MKKLTSNQTTLYILFGGLLVSFIIIIYYKNYFNFLNPFNYFYINPSLNPLIVILLAVCIFFMVREILTWYWKINKIVKLLEKIEENTNKKQ